MAEDVSNSKIRLKNLMKIKNFSLLEKLLLVTSYVLRFKNNLLAKIRKTPYTKGFTSTNKLKYAEILWIYSNQRKIIASSKFKQLKRLLGIFSNKENILRVKGRLSNAELLVWRAHKRVLHGGLNNILNFIRNNYWLCKGKKQLQQYSINVLLVKNLKVGRYLVLNCQFAQDFAWISIMHFVM